MGPSRRAAILWGGFGILGTVGCGNLFKPYETGGNSTKGYFQISPEPRLAKGGAVEFTLLDWEAYLTAKGNIGLRSPSSDEPTVAQVQAFTAAGSVTILGVEPGETEIQFTATADDESIDDSISLMVGEIAHVQFETVSCSGGYVRGEPGVIPYFFWDSPFTHTLYSLGLYPISWAPTTALSVDTAASDLDTFAVQVASDAPDTILLSSTVAGDTSSLSLPVIDGTRIDGIGVRQLNFESTVGKLKQLEIWPVAAQRLVCSSLQRVVRSTDEAVCRVTSETAGAATENRSVAVAVQLVGAGACMLTVEYLDFGVTLTSEIFNVSAAPSSSSSSGDDDWDWD
jgi:hypothetical protein